MQGLWASNMCAGGPCASLNLEPTGYLLSLGWPQRGRLGGQAARGRSAPINNPSGTNEATIIVDPPDHILPYQPWAKARRDTVMMDYLHPSPSEIDSQTRGWPNGIPRENYYTSHDGSIGGPIEILQPPGYVVFFYETHHEFRIVPLDGRPHPRSRITLWEGDSRGHWEGNTLVIDVTNLNDSTRFDAIGDFHSDALHVVERWTFVDLNTIDYRATLEDPKVFTRPWTIAVRHTRNPPDSEVMEYAGVEGDTAVATAAAIAKDRRSLDRPERD